MEQNSKSANERSRRKPFISVLVAVLVAALTAFVATPLMSNEKAYAAEIQAEAVTDWTGLKRAIESASDNSDDITIIPIANDIWAEDGPIDISGKKIKIQGEGNNVTIWRDEDNTNFSMFTVGAGGDLTLGDNLTLSGQTGPCGNDDFTIIWKAGYGDKQVIWSTDGNYEGSEWKIQRDDEQGGPTFAAPTAEDGTTYTFDGWKVEGINLQKDDPEYGSTGEDKSGVYKPYVSNDIAGTVTVVAQWKPVVNVSAPAATYDGTYNGRIKLGNVTTNLVPVTITYNQGVQYNSPMKADLSGTFYISQGRARSLGQADFASANEWWQGFASEGDVASEAQNNGLSPWNDAGGRAVYSPAGLANYPKYQWSVDSQGRLVNGLGWALSTDSSGNITFVNTNGSSSSGDSSGTAFEDSGLPDGSTPSYDTPNQGCDNECAIYSPTGGDGKLKFESGTAENPRGFFVQVNSGGTAKLAGATLTNFITEDHTNDYKPENYVSWVAPVVANGGTFDIESGSITKNSVGYSANNSKNADKAEDIEKYIQKSKAVENGSEVRKTNNEVIKAEEVFSITDTAGGIIYTNGGTGTITGGSVNGNRGDAGGIAVRGTNSRVELISEGKINNNVGVHYAGGAFVELGGSLYMDGGEFKDNFSWDRGGAVYVSSEDYETSTIWPRIAPKVVEEATFVMENGTIENNYAVNRGGAIHVASNNVVLVKGDIKENYCRSTGGAIYVEGDGDERMYQLYIPNACINSNHAVSNGDSRLRKNLQVEVGCDFTNELVEGDVPVNSWYMGYGGGLHLCAFGGNATFGTETGMNVIFKGNDATTAGQDMHLQASRPGAGSAINILNNYSEAQETNLKLYREVNKQKTNEAIVANKVYPGDLDIIADPDQTCDGALTIEGNVARVGGAIASNGTVIFGPAEDIYRAHTELLVEKEWSGVSDADRKNIKLQLAVKDGDDTYELDGYSIVLDGEPDEYVGGTGDENVAPGEDSNQYNDASLVVEYEAWKAKFGMPLIYRDSQGNVKSAVVLNIDGEKKYPSNPSDLPDIFDALKGTANVSIDESSPELVIIETIDGQEPTEYTYSQEDVSFNLTASKDDSKELSKTVYKDRSGREIDSVTTNRVSLIFNKGIKNENTEEPAVEKYVNNKVHDEIVNFDQEVEYSIMAYVPTGATKVVIADTLSDDLLFVDLNGNVQGSADFDASKMVINSADKGKFDFIIEGSNNHRGNGGGTVWGHTDKSWFASHTEQHLNDPINGTKDSFVKIGTLSGDNFTEGADGKTIYAEITKDALDAHDGQMDAHGKWLVLSFRAVINPASYDKVAAQIATGQKDSQDNTLAWEHITDNKTVVQGDPDHAGVSNKAQYRVTVGNESSDWNETNTVTVKPETITLKADKKWLNENGQDMGTEWPKDENNDPVKVKFTLWKVSDDEEEQIGDAIEITDYPDEPISFPTQKKLKGVSYEIREEVIGIHAQIDDIDIDPSDANDAKDTVPQIYTFTNKLGEKPEVEKYVNNKVHVNLENFDQVFEYSIMGYVPEGATEVTITDELVSDLLFVDANGKIQGIDSDFDAKKVVVNQPGFHGLVIEGATNNHNGNGSGRVSGHNDTWFDNTPGRMLNDMLDEVTINDNKISITITEDMIEAHAAANGGATNDLRGKNVILSYKAVINPDSYSKVLEQITKSESDTGVVDGLSWEKVTNDNSSIDTTDADRTSYSKVNNGADVEADGSHAGVTNIANYKVKIGNSGDFDYDTNTVTVKPEYQELTVEKTWTNTENNAWPTDVTSVTFGIFQTKDDTETTVKGTVAADGKLTLGGNADATVVLTSETTSQVVKALPKLEGVSYSAREIKVGDTEVTYNDGNITGVAANNDVSYTVKMVREKTTGSTIDDKFIAQNSLPQSEKYVNQKVHADLETFDKGFTYDIMAYVPEGATAITISDTLIPQLVLKSTSDEIKASAQYKDENDHKVGSSVAEDGTPISEDDVTVTIDPDNANKVDVRVVNTDGVLDGKWVQVTLKAEISEKAYKDVLKKINGEADAPTDEDLNWANITENTPVVDGDAEHKGLSNKASYKIEIDNQSTSDYETNTVTVEPKTEELTITKKWDGDTADDRPNEATFKAALKLEKVTEANDDTDATTEDVTDDYKSHLTITDNSDNTWTAKWTKLPKLTGVTYQVAETQLTGYDEPTGSPAKDKETITNKKTVTPDVEATIDAQKILLDADKNSESVAAEAYTFKLTANDNAPMPENYDADQGVKNGADAKATFGTIKYPAEAKTYTYTVTEVEDTTDTDTVYDKTSVTVTVEVKQNDDDEWITEVKYARSDDADTTDVDESNANAAVFVNKEVGPGEVEISVIKALKKSDDAPANAANRTLKAKEFEFTIEGADDASKAKMPTTTTVKNAANGAVSFGTINYDTEGTYTYIIKEKVPEEADKDPLISKYADNQITVTVKVEQDGDALKAVATYDAADKTFTNEYTDYTPTSLVLTAKKTIDGEEPADEAKEAFSFELYEGEETTAKQTKKNEEGGVITFDNIDYTKDDAGKTFTYTIKEVIPEDAKNNNNEDDNYKYDADVKTVTVEVSLNGTKVEAKIANEVKTTHEAGTFNNTTKVPDVEATIDAQKILLDADKNSDTVAAEAYTFKLTANDNAPMPENYNAEQGVKNGADAKATFGTIKYPAEAKKYTYTVTEVNGSDDTIVYDPTTVNVEVEVKQENNEWTAVVTYTRADDADTSNVDESKAEAAIFVNKKVKEGSVKAHIEAQKILYNKSTKQTLAVPNGAFTFTIAAAAGNTYVPTALTAATGTDGIAVFGDIVFDTAGEYKYVLSEVIPDNKVEGLEYDETKVNVTIKVEEDDTNTDATVVKFKTPTVTYERADDTDTTDNETNTNKFVNKTDDTEIEVEKSWVNVKDSDKVVADFISWLKLYRKAAEGSATWEEVQGAVPEVNTDSDNWSVKYTGLARYVANSLTKYVYSVVENAPEDADFNVVYTNDEESDNDRALDGGTITNEKIETEKYVKNNVTYDFTNFDEVFEYEIMGYVSSDAVSIEFTDDLNAALKFADNVNVAMYAMGTENDHKTTVAGRGTAVTLPDEAVTVTGKSLKVALDGEDVKALQGQWVKVTFNAQIDEGYYNTVAAKISEKLADEDQKAADSANWANIDDNLTVEIDTKHDGVPNQAGFKLTTSNGGEFDKKTNTVTVEPKTTELKVNKIWKDADGNDITTWPTVNNEPVEVVVQLQSQKGNVVTDVEGKTTTLTSTDTYTFTDLPVLEGVTYSVKETPTDVNGQVYTPTKTTNQDGSVTITNQPEKPEIEKFVKALQPHADLDAYDTIYDYEIVMYVPTDAEKIEMTDELVEELELVIDDEHKVTASVADAKGIQTGTDITTQLKVTGENKGGKLVTVVDGISDTSNPALRGKYVTVKFFAKIKDGADITKYTDEKVPNEASYIINDNPDYGSESNTVTVTPKKVNVTVNKEWKLGEATTGWPTGVTVKVQLKLGDDNVGEAVELTSAKTNHTWSNLKKYESKDYTVVETEVTVPADAKSDDKAVLKDGEGTVGDPTTDRDGNKTFTVTNKVKEPEKEEPEIEKYVEKDVHADIVNFDKEFEYDVIAYVPSDATAITITDALNANLDYVSTEAQIAASAVAIAKSDHTAKTGSVVAEGEPVKATATISGQNLSVRVENIGTEDSQQDIGGKSVRITLKAKIKDSITTLADLDLQDVKVNTPVITDEGEHNGIKNQAKYTIEIDNAGSSKPEYTDVPSNEVTVVPETVKYAGAKEWTGEITDEDKDGWPDDVQSVTFNLVRVKGTERTTVDTVTLDKNNRSKDFKEQPKLEGVTYEVEEESISKYIIDKSNDATGEDGKITTTITNKPEKPEVEKYVNNDVTWDFENFNQKIEYEIMAYVTADGKKLTITDTLVDALEFVGDGNIKVQDLGNKANNHSTTVRNSGSDVTAETKEAKDCVLTVVIDNIADKNLQGHWIKITFDAQIKSSAYDTVKGLIDKREAGDSWSEISDNGLVLINKTHDGIPNKANYALETENNGTYKEETNTVTVEPKTTDIEITKKWTGETAAQKETRPTADEFKKLLELVKVTVDEDQNQVIEEVTDAGDPSVADNEDDTYTIKWEKLPLLENVTYAIREKVFDDALDGYFGIYENTGDKEDATDVVYNAGTMINEMQNPEIEKYVNKDVDKIVALDETFTYDVIAYVTKDADKVTITDDLVTDLAFVSKEADVTVVDLGETVDHTANGSVTNAGTAVEGAQAKISGQNLTVTIANKLEEAAAPATGVVNAADEQYVTPLRGHWIKVTFQARIAEGKTVDDLTTATIKKEDNAPVQTQTGDHTGVPNQAKYTIEVGNEGKYNDESNTVTVKPEEPQIEKYVNKDVHEDIKLDDTFDYDVIVYVPSDADSIEITDTLDDQLTFSDEAEAIAKTAVVKATNDHKVNGTVAATDGTAIAATATIEKQLLTVNVADATEARGKFIQITFTAKIKDGLTVDDLKYEEIKDNGDVLEGVTPHEGVPNTAEYKIIVGNDNGSKYGTIPSNTVTVKPEAPTPEQPEIEKYVNQAVHKDIALDDTFTYDIIAWVTKDADNVVITDVLDGKIKFADNPNVKVTDLGENDNHKVVNDISNKPVEGNADATVAAAGTPVENAQVVTDTTGKKLTVTIPDATANRGHWVRVTFDAKLDVTGETDADKLDDAESAYKEIAATANAPVLSDEAHAGVPNTASYTIGVKKVVKDENGKPVFDENGNVVKEETPTPKYDDESNIVTVKPEIPEIEKHTIKISKSELGAETTEIPGATITVTGDNFSETWTSTTEAHELTLEPGRYTMVEVVAPEGYQQVTTEIVFEIDEDGKVTLITASEELDGNGKVRLEVNTTDHIVLEDAPNPTITVSKSSLGGSEIAGATITLRGADEATNGFVETWTSETKAHELTLKPGKYTMVEVVAPEGYQQVTTEMVFTVDKDGKVTLETTTVDGGGRVSAENDHINLEDAPIAPVSVVIEAEKTLVGGDLADGQFNFTLTGGDVNQTKSNAADGKVTFDEIKYTFEDIGTHTYAIAELVGNDTDMIYDTVVRSVTVNVKKQSVGEGTSRADVLVADVSYGEAGKAEFTNKVKQPGETSVNIVGNKTLTVNGNPADLTDGQFRFNITDPDGKVTTVTNKADGTIDFGTFTYNAAGAYSYSIAEVIDETDGMTYDTHVYSVVVNVTEGTPVTAEDGTVTKTLEANVTYPEGGVTFTNESIEKLPVVISKTDMATGEELPGATLIITDADGKEVDRWTSSRVPYTVQLAPGNYTLTEITAPFGYNRAESIAFTVGPDGLVGSDKVEMKDDANTIHEMFDLSVSISKTWTDGYGNAVAWPDGVSVTFTLQYLDKYTNTWVDYAPYGVPKTVTLDANKTSDTFDDLPAVMDSSTAQYRAVETKIAGYTQATSTVTDIANKVGTMNAVNIPEIPQDQTVYISKNSLGGSEIAGAHIVVYNADGSVNAEWDSTTEAHELTLKPGTYTMVETVAPEGYRQVTTAITFTVDANGNVTLGTTTVDNGGKISVMDGNHVILEDAPIPEIQKHTVKISKTDLGGTEIEGATIVIKDAKGNVVDEWTSDKTVHEVQLPAGTYTMIETVAPKGYEKVKTEITFMVDEDGKVTLLTTTVEGGEVELKDGVIVLKDAPIKVPTETTTPTPIPTKTPTTPNTPTTSRRTVTTPASSASVSKATSTGDSNNTVLWIVIAAIAAAAIAGAGVAVTRRRRRD